MLHLILKFDWSNKHNLNLHSDTLMSSLLPRYNSSRSDYDLIFIQHNFKNWLKGFISSPTFSQVVQCTKSKTLAKALILKIVIKLQSHFKTEIWTARCTAQKSKELHRGINLSTIIKSRSHRKSLASSSNHLNSYHTTDTNLASPLKNNTVTEAHNSEDIDNDVMV